MAETTNGLSSVCAPPTDPNCIAAKTTAVLRSMAFRSVAILAVGLAASCLPMRESCE